MIILQITTFVYITGCMGAIVMAFTVIKKDGLKYSELPILFIFVLLSWYTVFFVLSEEKEYLIKPKDQRKGK